KDDIYYIIFNSENRKDLEFLFNYNFDFTNILISSNTLVRGYRALLKAVEGSKLNSVLDIGCGDGIQGRIFSNYGKKVTGINLGYDELYNGKYLKSYGDIIIGDYLELDIKEKFDIIWLCHILEHIRDVEKFLIKLKKNINKGGTLAIIVPPNETDITVNHVHSFNTGRLLRYLVITGYDCRNISCFDYGYNKCLIINNIKFHNNNKNYITTEKEIKKAFKYLPEEITVNKLSDGNLIFNGNINKIN
ncbi:MAG: class I SAM-dependent methyltransferase, partial [Mollicutes bacterium]|nr:class I SAM-dependent methyltransferase [Mollicutes bacterium]